MNRQTLTLVTALGCGVSLYLMGIESGPSLTVSPETHRVSEESAEAQSMEEPTAEEELIEEQRLDETESTSAEPIVNALEIAFHAPFPDRVNLFQAPKRQGNGSANSVNKSESTVELLGFVNVGSQRAVLSIDGNVSPLEEGGKQFGIEVISIQPPTVVLQRGRQRWQATLEN